MSESRTSTNSGHKTAVLAAIGALFLTSFVSAVCNGQNLEGAVVRLNVVDPNHAAVVGARIRIGTVASITDANGGFSAALPPGEYALKIEADGFASLARSIKVTSAMGPIEVVLAIAESRAVVTITGADTFGYRGDAMSSATRTLTSLRDLPQSGW